MDKKYIGAIIGGGLCYYFIYNLGAPFSPTDELKIYFLIGGSLIGYGLTILLQKMKLVKK